MATETKTAPALDFKVIDEIIHRHNVEPGAVIPVLQEIQDTYGYVPVIAIQRAADIMNVPASKIFGIVTFYAQFRLQPLGKYLIRVCHGTACHLCGAEMVADTLPQVTGAKEGETSPDGIFTVERVACLGCCSLAPCIMINTETYGRLTPEAVSKVINDTRQQETATNAG